MCREGRGEAGFFGDRRGQSADLRILPEGIGEIGRFDAARFAKPVPAAPDFRDERGPVKLSQQGVRCVHRIRQSPSVLSSATERCATPTDPPPRLGYRCTGGQDTTVRLRRRAASRFDKCHYRVFRQVFRE
jgi:hypothetical protein